MGFRLYLIFHTYLLFIYIYPWNQVNESNAEQSKRTRLDIEMRRREVERDHDYWKPGSKKSEGSLKPVSREWNRLLNCEEENQPLRSIRFWISIIFSYLIGLYINPIWNLVLSLILNHIKTSFFSLLNFISSIIPPKYLVVKFISSNLFHTPSINILFNLDDR